MNLKDTAFDNMENKAKVGVGLKIGGMLYVVGAYLIYRTIAIWALIVFLSIFNTTGTLSKLTIHEIASGIAEPDGLFSIILLPILIIAFFKKHRYFPVMFNCLLLLQILGYGDYFITSTELNISYIEPLDLKILTYLCLTIALALYILRSKRVKQTFIY